jgi:hypothetical protein
MAVIAELTEDRVVEGVYAVSRGGTHGSLVSPLLHVSPLNNGFRPPAGQSPSGTSNVAVANTTES